MGARDQGMYAYGAKSVIRPWSVVYDFVCSEGLKHLQKISFVYYDRMGAMVF